MSIDLVAAALWLDMEPTRKLVLVALAERANLRGECWPGRTEIAARASLTPRRVTPHLKALQADGYIVEARRRPLESGRGSAPTRRVLAVKRILSEGEARRAAILAAQDQRDEPSPWSDDATKGTLGDDQGDAVTLGTVIEPSDRRDLVERPTSPAGGAAGSTSSKEKPRRPRRGPPPGGRSRRRAHRAPALRFPALFSSYFPDHPWAELPAWVRRDIKRLTEGLDGQDGQALLEDVLRRCAGRMLDEDGHAIEDPIKYTISALRQASETW